MKIKIGKHEEEIDNDEAKLVLFYKGHGMECERLDVLGDDVIEIDCARTLEYAEKYITMEEQIAFFHKSSMHKKCFDILWNSGFAENEPNKQTKPPRDLAEFKQSGSGMKHSIVLIMLLIHAYALMAMGVKKKVYLRNHPESHLHPAIQANLASLLIKFAMDGWRSKQSEFDLE